MSNFQADAATAKRASRVRGKNAVQQSDTNPQITQISQAQAPAVGALAPLVMPVPNYQSANILGQALAAVQSFGQATAQLGNAVERTVQENRVDQFRLANNEFNQFRAMRDRAQLDPNYEATMKPYGANPLAFVEAQAGNIGMDITDPEARRQVRDEAARLASREVAPHVAQYNKEQSSSIMQGYAAQYAGGTDPIDLAGMEDHLARYGVTEDHLLSNFLPYLVENAGQNANKGLLDRAIAAIPADKKILYEGAFKAKYQDEIDKQAAAKERHERTLLNGAMEAASVDDAMNIISTQAEPSRVPALKEEYGLKLIKANPYMPMAEALKVAPLMSSAIGKAEYASRMEGVAANDGQMRVDGLIQGVGTGNLAPQTAMQMIAEGVSQYDPSKPRAQQDPKAFSVEEAHRFESGISGAIKAMQQVDFRNQLVAGEVAFTEDNLVKAGSRADYRDPVAQVLMNKYNMVPAGIAQTMIAGAMNGDPAATGEYAKRVIAGANIDIPKDVTNRGLTYMQAVEESVASHQVAFDKAGNPTPESLAAIQQRFIVAERSSGGTYSVDDNIKKIFDRKIDPLIAHAVEQGLPQAIATAGTKTEGWRPWWWSSHSSISSGQTPLDPSFIADMNEEVTSEFYRLSAGQRTSGGFLQQKDVDANIQKAWSNVANHYSPIVLDGRMVGLPRKLPEPVAATVNAKISAEIAAARLKSADVLRATPYSVNAASQQYPNGSVSVSVEIAPDDKGRRREPRILVIPLDPADPIEAFSKGINPKETPQEWKDRMAKNVYNTVRHPGDLAAPAVLGGGTAVLNAVDLMTKTMDAMDIIPKVGKRKRK